MSELKKDCDCSECGHEDEWEDSVGDEPSESSIHVRTTHPWKDRLSADFFDLVELAAKQDRQKTEYLLRRLGVHDLIGYVK